MAKYFISYAYFLNNGDHGFGNIEADRSWPISSQADVIDLTGHITDSLCRAMNVPSLKVTIIGWQRFEDDIERELPRGENKYGQNIVLLRPAS